MASSVPLIRSSLLSEFPALVRQLGGPLDDILEDAGLSLEQIEQPTPDIQKLSEYSAKSKSDL